MRPTLLFVSLWFLTACEGDKALLNTGSPNEGGFEFVSKVTPFFPLEDGEPTRLRWLSEFNDANGFCSGGFDIIERQFVDVPGTYGKVIYTAVCR